VGKDDQREKHRCKETHNREKECMRESERQTDRQTDRQKDREKRERGEIERGLYKRKN
jgi:hypothetical protein